MSEHPSNPYGYDLDGSWPAGSSAFAQAFRRDVEVLIARERMDPAQREAEQFRRLREQLAHFQAHSPRYRRRLEEAGITVAELREVDGPEALRRLPQLDREDLLDPEIFATRIPEWQAPIAEVESSGSTQLPLTVRRTTPAGRMMSLQRILELLRYRADFSARYAITRWRASDDPLVLTPERAESWPLSFELGRATGPYLRMPMLVSVEEQLRLLRDFDPGIYRAYPGNLAALTRHLHDAGERLPNVRLLRTLGEELTVGERERIEAHWGAPVSDMYGTSEAGTVAALCPEGRLYHLAGDNVIVEVLDETGEPCAEGETGEVVLSCLTNYATPIIRYRPGDRATVGPAECPCGRTDPTLRSIDGRVMQSMLYPDGDEVQFLTLSLQREAFLPLSDDCQLVQLAPDELEIRYLADSPRDAAVEQAAAACFREEYRYPGEIRMRQVSEMPRTRSGKRLHFIPLS